jgi:ABC-type uncharacterized transport system substrate-binding protein
LSLWALSSRQLVLTVVLALCASCGFARAGLAHPHVWVTIRSEIVFSPNHQIIGIRHAWSFDELYTAMAMQGIDADRDGILSKEELKPVVDAMVASLKPFDYFTYVHLHGEENVLPLKPPEHYSLDYNGKVLTLHFTLLLEKPVDASNQKVEVDVYDPSFYVAFGFDKDEPVKLAGTPVEGCSAEIKTPDPGAEENAKNLSEAFFSQLGPNSNFGAQFAQTAIITCAAQ